ncbi:MAG: hypothetical protein IPP46_12485 [Bacteroidetes bacterium]|nr:hypothetical protein [Bacteroidota bacterium]
MGAAYQSASVAVSADGNTLMTGGYGDNSNQGAVWVFSRAGNAWSQQGSKLVGFGNNGAGSKAPQFHFLQMVILLSLVDKKITTGRSFLGIYSFRWYLVPTRG